MPNLNPVQWSEIIVGRFEQFARPVWNLYFRVLWRWQKPVRSRGNIPKQRKIIKNWYQNAYVKRPTWHNTLKLAKSSSAFGQRSLLTLINDSLSSNFRGIFLSSFLICVQSLEKHWPRCVKISCQKISTTRKSPEGWHLTFWPKVLHEAPSFHLPLEYEVRRLYIENIHSNCTWNNGLFIRHNDLDLQTGDSKLYVCLPVVL